MISMFRIHLNEENESNDSLWLHWARTCRHFGESVRSAAGAFHRSLNDRVNGWKCCVTFSSCLHKLFGDRRTTKEHKSLKWRLSIGLYQFDDAIARNDNKIVQKVNRTATAFSMPAKGNAEEGCCRYASPLLRLSESLVLLHFGGLSVALEPFDFPLTHRSTFKFNECRSRKVNSIILIKLSQNTSSKGKPSERSEVGLRWIGTCVAVNFLDKWQFSANAHRTQSEIDSFIVCSFLFWMHSSINDTYKSHPFFETFSWLLLWYETKPQSAF